MVFLLNSKMEKFPSRRSIIEATIEENIFEEFFDGGQKPLSMKDQEQMLSDLKKENFDLKLRLYMTQKTSDSAEGKVDEYEEQLAALLHNLEEQQKFAEQQNRELREAKLREKEMHTKQKNLEEQCKNQSEQIHNLSVNISKMSASMNDLSSSRHSTPLRNAKSSAYLNGREIEETSEESEISTTSPVVNISHVAPMRRESPSVSSYGPDNMSDSLLNNERSDNSYVNISTPTTKNYYTTSNDNVGVVRPNNSRTVVDVELPETSKAPLTVPRKKKGLMRVFKLCTGKSGQAIAREESMYRKRDTPPRIRMTTTME